MRYLVAFILALLVIAGSWLFYSQRTASESVESIQVVQPPTKDDDFQEDFPRDDISIDCFNSRKEKIGFFSFKMTDGADGNRVVKNICWHLGEKSKCEDPNISFLGGSLSGQDGYTITCNDKEAQLILGQSFNYVAYTKLGFKLDGKSDIIFIKPEDINESDECLGAGCRSLEDE